MFTAVARGRGRALRRAILILLASALIAGGAFLPYAGRFLATQDPLERGDAIVVLAGSSERWLEAVDLFNEGWAPRIVLSPGRPDEAERELRRRGISFPSGTALIQDAMVSLGVPADAVTVMPGPVDNTAHEAVVTRRLAIDAGWRRILVVTSAYHGRRARFAFRRAFHGMPTLIVVRTSRYDPSTPRRWWRARADIRWVTSELQKLLLYGFGVRE